MLLRSLSPSICIVLLSATIFAQPSNNRAGKLDPAFGLNGIATVPGNVSPLGGSDMLRAPTGNVFYTYTDNASLNRKVVVVKQNPDGSLDNSFGQNGTKEVTMSFDQHPAVDVISLTLQADGKLLIGGSIYRQTGVDGFVMRLGGSGEVDKQFGSNGIVEVDFSHAAPNVRSDDFLSRVRVDNQARIVVLTMVGHLQNPNTGNLYTAVTRIASNGLPDPTFGTGGTAMRLIGQYNNGTFDENKADLQIQEDGMPVVGYTVRANNAYNSFVMRYQTNGVLDSGFSDDGVVSVTRIPDQFQSWLSQISVLGNNKILALLSDGLTRLNSDGSLDLNFGVNGYVFSSVFTSDFSFDGAAAKSFMVTDDNKIVVSGWGNLVGGSQIAVLRKYWSDGTPEIQFGRFGKSSLFIQSFYLIKILAVQDNRYIVAACAVGGTPCSARFFASRKG